MDDKQLAELTNAAVSSIGFFTLANTKLSKVDKDLRLANNSSLKTINLLTVLLEQRKQQDTSIPVEKQSITSLKEKDSKNKFKVNNALLATVVAGLVVSALSKESREYLVKFIEGLIGTDAVKKLNEFNIKVNDIITVFGNISKIVAGIFIVTKLLSTVKNTINLIKQLAILTGLLSALNDDEGTALSKTAKDINAENEKIRAHYERIKKERIRLNEQRLNLQQKELNQQRNAANIEQKRIREERALQEEKVKVASEREALAKERAAVQASQRAAELREQRGISKVDAARQAEKARQTADILAQRVTTDKASAETLARAQKEIIDTQLKEKLNQLDEDYSNKVKQLEEENTKKIKALEQNRIAQEETFKQRTAELDKRQSELISRNSSLDDRQALLDEKRIKLEESKLKLQAEIDAHNNRVSKIRSVLDGVAATGAAGIASKLTSAVGRALAFLAWPLVGATFSTVSDLFNDEIRESESIVQTFLINLANELSFGFLTRENLYNTWKVLNNDEDIKQRNRKEIEGLSFSGEMVAAVTTTTDENPPILSDKEQKKVDEYNRKRKIEEDTARYKDLVNFLNAEEKFRVESALPRDQYTPLGEKQQQLKDSKGNIFSESNKDIKEWLSSFFSKKTGEQLDDKSYELKEMRRLLRVQSINNNVMNNTIVIAPGG